MSYTSRGKSSERITNTSYNNINQTIHQHSNHHNNSTRNDRENQQKDLVTEMKRLKKNFQELKSPELQKLQSGVNGARKQEEYEEGDIQQNQAYQLIYNSQKNRSYDSNEQYNSNQQAAFSNQQNHKNSKMKHEVIQVQADANNGKTSKNQIPLQNQHSFNNPSKYQQMDSQPNYYVSFDNHNSGESNSMNNSSQRQLLAQGNNCNQSLGQDSNRSQNGSLSNLTYKQGSQHQDKQMSKQQQQAIIMSTSQQHQQQWQQHDKRNSNNNNNSLKRISDKINNIKDRADKIEQIKSIEKKHYQEGNSYIEQDTSTVFINQKIINKKESKDCQTDDITSIYVDKKQNDDNLQEIERLRQQLKNLEQELDAKELNLLEQEKSLTAQINEKQTRLVEQDVHLEKVLDDLNRLQKENIKVNAALKQTQENLALNGKNMNNTSSQQLLPSEFKSKWEVLTTDAIANTFINFFDNPIILTNLIQDLFIIVHDITKQHIKDTNNNVMQLLSLDKKHQKAYDQNISKLYQDFNNDIFRVNADSTNPRIQAILSKFKQQADKAISHQYYSEFQNMKSDYLDEEEEEEVIEQEDQTDDNREQGSGEKGKEVIKKISIFRDTQFFTLNMDDFKQYLEELYESSELLDFIEQFYRLSIHMHLNDPPLYLQTQNFKNRTFEYVPYKKNNFYLIDGFVQQNAPALKVIPPILRNNQIYNGIKPSVILLTEDFLNDRIQFKIDAAIQKEVVLLNENIKNENLGTNGIYNSNPSPTTNLKEKPQLEKYLSPKLQKDAEKEIKLQQSIQAQNSMKSQKSKASPQLIQSNKIQIVQINEFDSKISNQDANAINLFDVKDAKMNEPALICENQSALICEKETAQITEKESAQKKEIRIQSSDKKQRDNSIRSSKYSSKENNKENQESYINQSISKPSPNSKSIKSLKNMSQLSQKYDSAKLSLISPKLDSSKNRSIASDKDKMVSSSKNGQKYYSKVSAQKQQDMSLSCSSKKRYESSHSEKKKASLSQNKSGIFSPNYSHDNGKDEIVKNLFLTSRSHHQTSQITYPTKSVLQGQLSIKSGLEMEKRVILDDLTSQTSYNVQQSQQSKFINHMQSKNTNFLKKGAFVSKNQNSISQHISNTANMSNFINKKTQESVHLLRTLQAENKHIKKQNYCQDVEQQDEDNEEQQQDRFTTPYLQKNTSFERQEKKDAPSHSPALSSNRNEPQLNDSTKQLQNGNQDRSGVQSNNQSSSKLRRSNRSEEENRIINQNTIFNKHFKRNSIQNEALKNIPVTAAATAVSQQQQTIPSKQYTFNTFLENHRRNIQRNEKEQSMYQHHRQDSSSSSRDMLQVASSNMNMHVNMANIQKEQLNKSAFNSSRLYKKDSFDLKSSTLQQHSMSITSNLQNQSSFSKSPIDSKIEDNKKLKQDDLYVNLRRQISLSSQHTATPSTSGQGNNSFLNYNHSVMNNNNSGLNNCNDTKQSKHQPLKSSRDISPSPLLINCSKTDRNMKYSDLSSRASSNLGNYFPPEVLNPNLQKSSNLRTVSMKRALQNMIDSSSSEDEEDELEQTNIERKLRDTHFIQDESLIEELSQPRDNHLNNSRQTSHNQMGNKCPPKHESNENRPFSFQSCLPLQTQHKKNKTFEKLYNDLKQKKSFTSNSMKSNKEILSNI